MATIDSAENSGKSSETLSSDKWSGDVLMYNLDVVIAVGYRVNSYEATQFRIWATRVLKEYLFGKSDIK